ncbi:hypothetical protein P3T17_003884, partial [Paraburkholderia sp. GAS82]
QFSRRKHEAAKAQPHQSLDRLPAHAFLHGLGHFRSFDSEGSIVDNRETWNS